MASADIWSMCGGRNISSTLQTGSKCFSKTQENYSKTRRSGMEFESDWTKLRKSSAFSAQAIRSATSFMTWHYNSPVVPPNILIPKMPALVYGETRVTEMNKCFTDSIQQGTQAFSKCASRLTFGVTGDLHNPILPGLPDDVAKYCLALVPRSKFPVMAAVCKRWRSFIKSNEFLIVRRLVGVLEEWLYVLTMDADGNGSHWEVLDCLGHQHRRLPPMPGDVKAGFSVVVLNGKLLVIAGYSIVNGTLSASSDVYQYDSCLNSWSKLANLNVARYDFACAEVNGMVFAVGGHGADGESLSSAEIYNPETDKWTTIESLHQPRYNCFGYGFGGKLYVMGGRSSFTIGNSKKVDVYNPESHTWCQMKNGCVMVTAHALLGKKLFCMEWKNQRKLSIFDHEDNSWKIVAVPVTGSRSIDFRFGILDGKLFLFPLREEPGYTTLLYDPNATPGSEWKSSPIKPSGLCVCSVTIQA